MIQSAENKAFSFRRGHSVRRLRTKLHHFFCIISSNKKDLSRMRTGEVKTVNISGSTWI
jgi:hypothetical protein